MSSGKKILRLFSRLNVGGPSLHVVNLTRGLRAFGYETVLAVGEPAADEGSMEGYAEELGVRLVRIPGFQAAISPWNDLRAFFAISRLIRTERPDIVHTHTFKAGLLGRLAAWIHRVPLVVHTYHGHLLHGYWNRALTWILCRIETALNRITDRVVAVSPAVGHALVEAAIVPARKMQVVHLGFDLDRLMQEFAKPSSLRHRFGLSPSAITIGLVGRMVPIKNGELFLRALSPLLAEFPDLHLLLIGDGPERPRLESLAAELCRGVRGPLFCGFVQPMGPEWKDLDLCVCTSRNEGTSVAIIEAILAGVPVISTAVGGMVDLLEGGRWGRLLPEDEAAIRRAVREWLIERSARTSAPQSNQAASLHFQETFALERLIRETHQLYQSSEAAP